MCGVNHENICTQPAEANSRRNERLFEEVGVDIESTKAQFYGDNVAPNQAWHTNV
jgi:hypothetical protein